MFIMGDQREGGPMRIAMLSPMTRPHFHRRHARWEKMVSLLAGGLLERGEEVSLFATGDAPTGRILRAVEPTGKVEDTGFCQNAWEFVKISEVFERAQEFDIIHNHFDVVPLTYSGLIGRPMLTTIHGFSANRVLPVYEKYNQKNFYVSVSNSDRSPRLKYIATIYYGINLDIFTFRSDPGEYLLYTGRINPDNGVGDAVEIAERSGVKLVIAGEIDDHSYFESEIKPLMDSGAVEYIGLVNPENIDALLGGALALLYPTSYDEPFGLSAVEANACGTPVIAFDRGSIREIIVHGVNGFLVDNVDEAVDAVGELAVISREDCRKLTEEKFSMHRMVDDYLRVYREILQITATEDRRPWGYYEVLSEAPDHKVKRIVVWPGKRLSLQRHTRRSEQWTIVSGHPVVTLGEEEISLNPGDSIRIPLGARHRVANPGDIPVLFVEVQLGDYMGEDDIERFEDDFGRPAHPEKFFRQDW
jgi:glycosyltransferase involved in cell wall biosynthesis/quercetin dioxygenase-like cupin family protein